MEDERNCDAFCAFLDQHATAKLLNSPIVILFAVYQAVSRITTVLRIQVLRAPTASEAIDVPRLVGGQQVVAVEKVEILRILEEIELSFVVDREGWRSF